MSRLIGAAPIAEYPLLDRYWSEPQRRWPYWITDGAANAGFVLVNLNEDVGRFEIAEFYVSPACRRRGVGTAAARMAIARHPGPWRITQREANEAAIAFWHGVLDGFAHYEEIASVTDAARREQRFMVM